MALPRRVSTCSPPYVLPACPVLISASSDVGYESYKAHRQGPSPIEAAHFSEPTRIGMIAVKRAVFQSVASMCVFPLFPRNACVHVRR